MNKQPQPGPAQLNVDLKTTEGMKNSEGGSIFKSAVILRKVSKFVAGTDADAIKRRALLDEKYLGLA